jgi:filamentous hemagglutinin
LDGGKYGGGSNNGFDHVLQSADGTVTILLDSKQFTNGATKLSESNAGQQLSDAWVRSVLGNLDKTSDAYQAVLAALNSGTLVKGVAGVDKATGTLKVIRMQ